MVLREKIAGMGPFSPQFSIALHASMEGARWRPGRLQAVGWLRRTACHMAWAGGCGAAVRAW